MHYAEFKQDDPELLKTLIQTFPFAVIAINGASQPVMAQAPLTFRDMGGQAGTIDFHLARANTITDDISDGTNATILVNGPNAHISPSWCTQAGLKTLLRTEAGRLRHGITSAPR